MNGVHLVFLFSFNELARLGDEVGTGLRCLIVQREKESMEDFMHLPGRREAKVVGVRGDDLKDLEKTFSSRG